MSKTKTIYQIRLLYQSGQSVDLEVLSFDMKIVGGKITEATWEMADPTKRVIFLGIDHIVAIFQLGVTTVDL
jgi:hypothetical protein